MSFKNKVVMVTGAASGVGAAIALSFARLNANLCITDIDEQNLLKTKGYCEEVTDGKVLEVVADISKDKDVKKIVGSALKELETIDVLVNCAGILGAGGLHDSDIVERFDKVISVNLRSVIVLTKEALPGLIKSRGCIVNISSIASTLTWKNMMAYCISKAGITNFTKNAAFELAEVGIRVNCISPGPVKTNILLNAGVTEAEHHKYWKNAARKSLLKSCVKAEEIAELTVYLASDKAVNITGSDFAVDAGVLVGGYDDAPDPKFNSNYVI